MKHSRVELVAMIGLLDVQEQADGDALLDVENVLVLASLRVSRSFFFELPCRSSK